MNYLQDISINFNLNLPDYWLNIIDPLILDKTNKLFNEEIEKFNNYEFYPYNINDIFKIFNLCKLEDIKVVILGQDPYYANKEQANGIAFSVNEGVRIPPSLRNIYKEAKKDTTVGDLSEWVKQGVFLLNASLTVKEKHPNSHEYIWKDFINHIIEIINNECNNVIFVSWGKSAANRYNSIDLNRHKLLSSSHPSPLSCYKTDKPFIGSDVFNKINEILKTQNKEEIKW